jgi:hypothetical protein
MDPKIKFPADMEIYDAVWNMQKMEWIKWTDTVEAYYVDSRASYDQITVPTFDSIRM